jgi:hypothetical protein
MKQLPGSALASMTKAKSKFSFEVMVCAIFANILIPGMSLAQVPCPIVDATSEADAATTVSYMSSDLKVFTQISATMNSVLNVEHDISTGIGFVGSGVQDLTGGSIGELIADAQMGMQDYKQATTDYEEVASAATSLITNPLGSISILTMFQDISQSVIAQATVGDENTGLDLTQINELLDGALSPTNAVYVINNQLYLATATPTNQQIEQLNGARRATEENAAITAFEDAANTSSTYQEPQQSIEALSSAVAGSTDERGDWKANSGIWLKVLEQQIAQTQMLGKMLEMASLSTIDSSGNYGPNAGTAIP